eukprot:scaffold9604_cov167-Skeletonema_dohrnii-CCMP3373.AAC.8
MSPTKPLRSVRATAKPPWHHPSTIVAFIVDFVIKMSVFCSLFSAGLSCKTGVFLAPKWRWTILAIVKIFAGSAAKIKKLDKTIFREPLVTKDFTRGCTPPIYVVRNSDDALPSMPAMSLADRSDPAAECNFLLNSFQIATLH